MSENQNMYPCRTCRNILQYIPQYRKYYCPICQKYQEIELPPVECYFLYLIWERTIRDGGLSGYQVPMTEYVSIYERKIVPAPFEKKILKSIGRSVVGEGITGIYFYAGEKSGRITDTAVIVIDNKAAVIYFCRTGGFVEYDEIMRRSFSTSSGLSGVAWWFSYRVNDVKYISQAIGKLYLTTYALKEVIFCVEKNRIQIENSLNADELLRLFLTS